MPPLCSFPLVLKLPRATESKANFITRVMPPGTSAAKGATSNVRLFTVRF